MNAGIEHEEPQHRAADQVGQKLHHAHPVHDEQDDGGGKSSAEIGHGDFGRVENGDDDDSRKIIQNCKRRQKHLEARGNP